MGKRVEQYAYLSFLGSLLIATLKIIRSITLKEKLKASSVWRFFMLNLAWLGCWMLLLSVLAYVMNFVQAKYFLVVIIAFFIVLTNSIYSLFIATPNWKSVKDALYLTFRRFHRFVLSYILLWLMFFVIAKASSVFSHIAFSIITLIVLLIYVAIARAYVSRMVLEEYTLYSGELAGAHLNIRALKK